MNTQTLVDTLRGELREEKEYAAALEAERTDNGRVHNALIHKWARLRSSIRRKVVVAFLLGLLIGTLGAVGAAKAAPFTPELEADYAYAEQWWGLTPARCSSVTLETVPATEIGGAGGTATQPKGAGPVPCRMRVADNLAPCGQREVVLHEYGHLLGHGHSADPANVMYPTPSGALCQAEVFGQWVTEVRAAVATLQARCKRKVRWRPRLVCRANVRQWRAALVEAEARLDGVQEPER